jgi:hypothetical protein
MKREVPDANLPNRMIAIVVHLQENLFSVFAMLSAEGDL